MPVPFVNGEDRVCWPESLAVGGQADQGFVLETTLPVCLLVFGGECSGSILKGQSQDP